MAADRDDAWRHSIFKAVNEIEEDRRDVQKDKRSKRKLEPLQTPPPDITFTTHGHAFLT